MSEENSRKKSPPSIMLTVTCFFSKNLTNLQRRFRQAAFQFSQVQHIDKKPKLILYKLSL